jgi:HD-GYP domain-containing protein (c-di-GMP phosphodiesterase class II)
VGQTDLQAVASADAEGSRAETRLAELLCALSFATGLATGAPMEHGLRSAYLGLRVAEALGLPAAERGAVYYGALLKDVGCTACAAGIAIFFPEDELAPRLDMLTVDPTRAGDVLSWLWRNVPVDAQLPGRVAKLLSFAAQSGPVVNEAMRAHCEVAELFARRLEFPETVQQTVRYQLERWDGKGFAAYHLKGEAAPTPARVLQLAQVLELTHALGGRAAARTLAEGRGGGRFDPAATGAFLSLAEDSGFWEPLDVLASEEAVAAMIAMAPPTAIEGASADRTEEVCEAVADFIDAKTRQDWHHSPTVAGVAVEIGRGLGFGGDDLTRLRRAALLHDVGKVAVPFGILEKGDRLSAAEREQVRLHTYYTQRVLERVGPLRELAPAAAAHHDWVNGEGDHRQLAGEQIPLHGRVLAVADAYVRATQGRDDGRGTEEALTGMRGGAGVQFDRACVEALAAARGQTGPVRRVRRRRGEGLSEREEEVLRLLAQGMSNPQIGQALSISRKTVEHHLEHVYTKLGVTCRTSAVAWAVQRGLV